MDGRRGTMIEVFLFILMLPTVGLALSVAAVVLTMWVWGRDDH